MDRSVAESAAGVVLVNLGSPASPSPRDVRAYLAELLGDRRVLDLAEPLRSLLLHGVILRTRPRKSARLYARVWTSEGSPLLRHSEAQRRALAELLTLPSASVRYASRYGAPRIAEVLLAMQRDGVRRFVIVPLYPQYSSAATGSAIAEAHRVLSQGAVVPEIYVAPPFYDHPGFIAAQAERIATARAVLQPDMLIYSYHGLPEHQVRACVPGESRCTVEETCCASLRTDNAFCYRAQCHATSRAIDAALGLQGTPTVFQSRMRGRPWIRPFTDAFVSEIAARGARRVLVACPSFVSDCLETLDEVGIRLAEQFARESGGGELSLVPCVNDHPRFIAALAETVRAAVHHQWRANDGPHSLRGRAA